MNILSYNHLVALVIAYLKVLASVIVASVIIAPVTVVSVIVAPILRPRPGTNLPIYVSTTSSRYWAAIVIVC